MRAHPVRHATSLERDRRRPPSSDIIILVCVRFLATAKDKESPRWEILLQRGEGNRDNASKFFTTIAAHFATKILSLNPSISKATEADLRIGEKSLREQYEKHHPPTLSRIPSASPQVSTVILVVDSLGECEREDDFGAIHGPLIQLRDATSVFLRVFITSGLELSIRLSFKNMSRGTYMDLAPAQNSP